VLNRQGYLADLSMQTGLTGHSTPSVTAGRSVAGHPFSSIPDRDEDRYQRRSQSLFGTSLRLGRGMPCPDTRVLRCVVTVVAPKPPRPLPDPDHLDRNATRSHFAARLEDRSGPLSLNFPISTATTALACSIRLCPLLYLRTRMCGRQGG